MSNFDRLHSVSFTGYRLSKMRERKVDAAAEQHLRTELTRSIAQLRAEGFDTFLSGMADGFDLWAAEAVIEAKRLDPSIHLTAVVPFEGHDKTIDGQCRQRYAQIIASADRVVCLATSYTSPLDFLRRNDYLVDNAAAVICYFDGVKGGTRYTVDRARRKGLRLVNLCSGYHDIAQQQRLDL